MKLYYKIEFNSTNSYYKNILSDFVKKDGINAWVKQFKNFILIICDDTQEKIELFFEYLGKNLPLSIFLGATSALDFFDESLQELKEVGIKENFEVLTNEKIYGFLEEENESLKANIETLKSSESIVIKNDFDEVELFLPNREKREAFEEQGYEVNILVCNLNKLTNIMELAQQDIQLLSTIERPLVKLKFKLLQNKGKEFSSGGFAYVKVPDSKELIQLAANLQNENIDYLLYVSKKKLDLKVTYNKEQNIIVAGNKAVFPMYDYINEEVYNTSNEFFDKQGFVPKASIINANKKTKKAVGVYFSTKSDGSCIFANTPKNGIKEIIEIPNIVVDLKNAIDEMSSIDEHTPRLIQNYKSRYTYLFEKEFKAKDSNGFEAILDIAAHLLEMKDHKEFEEEALNYKAKSGIQIDMKPIKIDDVNYLDYRRVIQTMLSYKMGDVDNRMIAYSFYESLSDFIKDNILKIADEMDTKDLVLCGNMFANSILLSKVIDGLGKTFDITISKSIPLDL